MKYFVTTTLFIALLTISRSFAAEEPKPPTSQTAFMFYGNSMVERILEQGELEARLQIAKPNSGLKIRSLAWTGDEVGNRLRLEGYAQHMKNLLEKWPSDTIVMGYGLYESFAGKAGLEEFKKQYQTHVDQLTRAHPGASFVLLSPIAIEGATAERNAAVDSYSKAIATIAEKNGAKFIDLFSLTRDHYSKNNKPITIDGIHLNHTGISIASKAIANSLVKADEPNATHLKQVALAAAAKHQRVAEVVRPKNAVVYFGVRKRPQEYADEMPRYHKMIELTEKVVHQMAADPSLTFANMTAPSLPPMPKGSGRDDGKNTGIIKNVTKQMAEFTTAEGYEVSLFASEEQFPELRNPVQIAFDAKGRLWVVTMPSFPHTVPGLTPPDKILILEDTDHDGKADKVTTYMEGLDALDGIAFHRDGVIISEQPRLFLTKDTDGDDVADTKIEILRGIDVTDSHHGGMIATDPNGDIIFSDGVFHRSQLETPFGVHRGIDATTYRFDPASGKINTEWQHITPNPWKVTFDQYGSVFQMYGDGIFFDGTALPWTPLGAYHPFNYGKIASYGKGSATAIVSSPNFPENYQQGMVSAALLGRYAVTLTEFDYDQGMIKAKAPLTILSSPNAAFRPADLEFGMDGALYVSDFCSPIIGHAQHPMRDPHWDHDYGRIWRVVNTKKPLTKAKDYPKIIGASAKELCKLLIHPQDLARKHARIELRKMGAAGVKAVDQWIASIDKSSPDFDQAALETLFVCGGLNEMRPDLIDALLKSKSFHMRGAAVLYLRLHADEISGVQERLLAIASDPHPRVQMEVIGAIAHLRQSDPKFNDVLKGITSKEQNVLNTLKSLDLGTEPKKGRSVPVLDVDAKSELTHWLRYAPGGKGIPVLHTRKRPSGGAVNFYRTFVHAKKACSAIIGIKHKSLEIKVNDILKFQQNAIWSGDQQVQVELKKGLNVIEIELVKQNFGRSKDKQLPPVFLYDATGQALDELAFITDATELNKLGTAHMKMLVERGQILRVQAAPELQFAPTQLSVEAGSKVRLIFSNPDVMMHNFLLLTPGSVEEVGALADKMAAQPGALEKHYVPASSKILVSTKILGPNAEQELIFTAPTEPGEYPYICTFPGHWRVMKGTLTVTEAPKPTPVGKSIVKVKKGWAFETANSPLAFKTLTLPTTAIGKVEANGNVNNDPLTVLTDGTLVDGFGPVFANGTTNGAYMMDLGKVKTVSSVTSWSHNKGKNRGNQEIEIYGSQHESHPGWKLSDKSRFQKLGTLSTKGQSIKSFTALSLTGKKGKALGKYRWIIWNVSPISGNKENTAFQELSVETK